jgi:hypothetical protein
MARLTRKMWIGIGAATVAGAALGGHAVAQHTEHKADKGKDKSDAAATKNPGDGGEAYLTDGGPRDTRVRFYRDLGLIRGHLLVGGELIELGLWDEALPHFLHPTEELYDLMEKYIKLHKIRPFKLELGVLSQAVKAKRKPAYEQARKVIDQRLDGALDTARKFMHPPYGFTARSATEMLKAALSEYESSIEGGRFVKPVEYQDSRGFVWQAERMIEGVAPDLDKANAEGLAKIRANFKHLKQAWPEPMPPPEPKLELAAMTALVSEIEQVTSGY